MKKTIKIPIIIILILTIMIISFILICFIPTKKISMQISITEGPFQELTIDEESQIYVTHYPEYPGWHVIGKDGIRFKDKLDHVYITGNFPHEINYDLIGNIFVLNGKYIGNKKLKSVDTISKCFYVDSWGVLGEVKRDSIGCLRYLSKSSLTVADEIFAEPFFVHDLDDFEDVDEIFEK